MQKINRIEFFVFPLFFIIQPMSFFGSWNDRLLDKPCHFVGHLCFTVPKRKCQGSLLMINEAGEDKFVGPVYNRKAQVNIRREQQHAT